jgi:AcrR family transcriptional regulator
MMIPRSARAQKTRDKLLRAAEKVFGDKGYYESSIAEITQKAGLGSGTFYIYFSSKYEIFEALVRNLNHEMRKSIKMGTMGLKSREETERKGFELFFDFVKKHRRFYRIIRQSEYLNLDLFKWYYSSISNGYSEGLEKAFDSGEFNRNDAEMISYALMGIADFVGMRYEVWEDSLDQKKLKNLMDFVLNGLKGRLD